MRTRTALLAVVGAAGLLAAAYRTHSAFAVVTEGLTLSKTASSDVVSPGDPVTYTYVVQNTGSETLHDLRVVDDAGTPNDASDDFVVGTAATIAPGETLTFTFTLIPTVQLCSVDSDGTHSDAGSLTTETLPNGDIVIRFVQSRDVVDNTYGVNAVGWPNGHTFAQLVGSDHAEFKLRDGAGNVVLYFAADYISQSSAYPSGYGTLGVTGGDGKMFVGSASDVLSVHTSISDDLNQSPAFYGYTKDSPPEPNPAWEYHDSYTVVVSGAKFAANGFGSVEIPYVHNSPAKKAPNAISPVPCDTEVTNVATTNATFTDAGGTVTTVNAAASASVLITTGSGGGGGSTDVGAEGATFSGKVMSVVLTNHGSTAATIQSLSLTWPSSNKSLVKIQNGGATIYDTKTTSTTATFTHWKGHLQDRQIKAGGSITLKLTFEANAATSVSLYSLGIDFGGGTKTLVP